MYFKFPKFNDIWGIRREVKWTLGLELIVLFILAVASYLVQPQYHSYELLIFANLSSITLFVYVYIMHYQSLVRANLPRNPCKVNGYLLHLQQSQRISFTPSGTLGTGIEQSGAGSSRGSVNRTMTFTLESTNTIPSKSGYEKGKDDGKHRRTRKVSSSVTLKNILEDKNGFTQFARHLTKEFCIENLLFIVELQQWQTALELELGRIESNDLGVSLPTNAPRSQIVAADDCYLQFTKLFKKYIINDAYFCVNISGLTRKKFYLQLEYDDNENKKTNEIMVQYLKDRGNIDEYALLTMFDAARREIFELLSFAFIRFKNTEEFREIAEILTANNNNMNV